MKKVISSIIFIILTVAILLQISSVLFLKINRFYMLDKYVTKYDAPVDVQVYGSCHAYTSFVPEALESDGITSFVYANPGEIVPTTYVRMVEQFKRHVPKVAVLDIWGINAYETYEYTTIILEHYMPANVQMLPYSREKVALMEDFPELDPLQMHFPLSQYKDRILDGSLTELDFDYEKHAKNNIGEHMTKRFQNSGFYPQGFSDVSDYPQKQNHVSEEDVLQIEPIIVKYLEKIFALCKENDVELILYKAPYISTVNELRKLNHLRQLCQQHDVLFIDLEKEMKFSYTTDFFDLYHLSTFGANRATKFLKPYIQAAMEK